MNVEMDKLSHINRHPWKKPSDNLPAASLDYPPKPPQPAQKTITPAFVIQTDGRIFQHVRFTLRYNLRWRQEYVADALRLGLLANRFLFGREANARKSRLGWLALSLFLQACSPYVHLPAAPPTRLLAVCLPDLRPARLIRTCLPAVGPPACGPPACYLRPGDRFPPAVVRQSAASYSAARARSDQLLLPPPVDDADRLAG